MTWFQLLTVLTCRDSVFVGKNDALSMGFMFYVQNCFSFLIADQGKKKNQPEMHSLLDTEHFSE